MRSNHLSLLCLELRLGYLFCLDNNVLNEALLLTRKVAGEVCVKLGLVLLHLCKLGIIG